MARAPGVSLHFVLAGFVCLALCLVGVATVVLQRERIGALAATRTKRITTALVLVAFQLAAPWLYEIADVKQLLIGSVSAPQLFALWGLSPLMAAVLTIEAFTAIHADGAEILRVRAEFERDDARRERNFFNQVATTFMGVVSEKRERLGTLTHRDQLLDALEPQTQITALIQAAWTLFNGEINDGGPSRAVAEYRVRVVLFRRSMDGAMLKPTDAWDGTSLVCTSRYESLAPHLSLATGPDKSLVVAVSKTGEPELVPDAEHAHGDPKHPFKFFDPARESVILKSIAAIPIRLNPEAPPFDVLVIDTDRPGYFDQASRRVVTTVAMIQKHLAHRLLLELQIETLCGNTRKGQS